MLKELNQVIDYIEDHLTDDLSLERISNYVGVSDYHFRTVFFHLSGMTLNEYVKTENSWKPKRISHGALLIPIEYHKSHGALLNPIE